MKMTNANLVMTRNHLRSQLFKFWMGQASEVTAATERETMEAVASLDGELACRDANDPCPTVAPVLS